MSISIEVKNAQRIGSNVWRATIEPSQVRFLAASPRGRGGVSIILSFEKLSSNHSSGSIKLTPDCFDVLNIGNTSDTIIIEAINNSEQVVERDAVTRRSALPISRGDGKFSAELPKSLQTLGTKLLAEVRSFYTGELVKMKSPRKYVESPENFWTVTIQPRVCSFMITVYGEPDKFLHVKNLADINLKKDMNGYSSFKLERDDQIGVALEVIQSSLKAKLRYRNR